MMCSEVELINLYIVLWEFCVMSFMGNCLAFVHKWLRNEKPLGSIRLQRNYWDIYVLDFLLCTSGKLAPGSEMFFFLSKIFKQQILKDKSIQDENTRQVSEIPKHQNCAGLSHRYSPSEAVLC